MRPRDMLSQPSSALTVWEKLKIEADARIRERLAQRRAREAAKR